MSIISDRLSPFKFAWEKKTVLLKIKENFERTIQMDFKESRILTYSKKIFEKNGIILIKRHHNCNCIWHRSWATEKRHIGNSCPKSHKPNTCHCHRCLKNMLMREIIYEKKDYMH